MPDQPATPGQPLPPEIEQIIKEMVASQVTAQVNERAKGFQRVDAQKQRTIDDLNTQLRELKLASLDPEEAVQFQQDELKSENERLRALLEVQNLMGEYPDEAPFFQQVLSAQDTKGQLEAMRAFAQSIKPQASAAPAGQTPPAPGSVDPNRPAATPTGPSTLLADGTTMDEARADMILRDASGPLSGYRPTR